MFTSRRNLTRWVDATQLPVRSHATLPFKVILGNKQKSVTGDDGATVEGVDRSGTGGRRHSEAVEDRSLQTKTYFKAQSQELYKAHYTLLMSCGGCAAKFLAVWIKMCSESGHGFVQFFGRYLQ